MMWLKRSMIMNWSTDTVPGLAMRERSLRARSTSMRCSERSFSSASSSSASARSSSRVAPRGREPAMGWVLAMPSLRVTSASGEEPTMWKGMPLLSSKLKRYMYGEGLDWRSTRYTSRGLALVSASNRRESTIWKTSPSMMFFLERSMASLKPCSLQVRVTSSRTLRSTSATPERMEVVAVAPRCKRRSMLCRRATASS